MDLSGRSLQKSLASLGSVSLFSSLSLFSDVCKVEGAAEVFLNREVTFKIEAIC